MDEPMRVLPVNLLPVFGICDRCHFVGCAHDFDAFRLAGKLMTVCVDDELCAQREYLTRGVPGLMP